jgi:branched-chain amino acid transport system ATP-binding protein
MSDDAPVLAVSGLRKAFGGVRAVDDVSFAVQRGELVALIGPTGAGTTTCFTLVNGQLVPDAGEVRLADARIDGRSSRASESAARSRWRPRSPR